jgi:hypothetical protein
MPSHAVDALANAVLSHSRHCPKENTQSSLSLECPHLSIAALADPVRSAVFSNHTLLPLGYARASFTVDTYTRLKLP